MTRHGRNVYGRWVSVKGRPGMVDDWTENTRQQVLVQLGSAGPFEWLPVDAVDPITEEEWYKLMEQK